MSNSISGTWIPSFTKADSGDVAAIEIPLVKRPSDRALGFGELRQEFERRNRQRLADRNLAARCEIEQEAQKWVRKAE